jgi:hypothetical protein
LLWVALHYFSVNFRVIVGYVVKPCILRKLNRNSLN